MFAVIMQKVAVDVSLVNGHRTKIPDVLRGHVTSDHFFVTILFVLLSSIVTKCN